MLYKKIWFCVFVFAISLWNGFAQTNSNNADLNTWTAIEVSYKLNKKWNFKLEEQLRLKDNAKIADQDFTELSTEYKVLKKVELAFGVRYINENDTKGKIQGYENHFRFNFDASYKHKIKRFSFRHRLRYQNKNELGLDDPHIENIRLKTALTYNIKGWKLDPKISGEIFNRLKNNDIEGGIGKYRLSFETKYKMNKIGGFSLFYKIDKEVNTNNPKTTNILGLSLYITLKNKSKS